MRCLRGAGLGTGGAWCSVKSQESPWGAAGHAAFVDLVLLGPVGVVPVRIRAVVEAGGLCAGRLDKCNCIFGGIQLFCAIIGPVLLFVLERVV